MSAIGMPQTSPVETEEVGSLALNGCDHQGHNLCARHREDRVDRPRGVRQTGTQDGAPSVVSAKPIIGFVMRVLLTGSSGWLGRFLAPRLRAAGHVAIGLDVAPGRRELTRMLSVRCRSERWSSTPFRTIESTRLSMPGTP